MPEPVLIDWLGRTTRSLREAGVAHALAGGLALATWSEPRATVDIDLVIAADAIDRARPAAEAIGLLQSGRRINRFKRVGLLRMLVPPEVHPQPISIDLLLVEPAWEPELLARAVTAKLAGFEVRVVSAEDLVLLKLLRFSRQDRADIAGLAERQRLDRRYLARQGKQLRILTRLRAAGLRT